MSVRTTVVVVASGAAWEAAAVGLIERDRSLVLLKRCVDVDDLLATVSTGQADVAVIAIDSPGLDSDAVARLAAAGTLAIAVLVGGSEAAQARASRIGLRRWVVESEIGSLPSLMARHDDASPGSEVESGSTSGPLDDESLVEPVEDHRGRVLVVWGPSGAPGRSTVAAAIAEDLAARGRTVTLIDADPYGGTLAQQLGVVDEVSGILAAGRMHTAGVLAEQWARSGRQVAERLVLLTGLPRPERWREIPAGMLEELVGAASTSGWVVIDTGPGLDRDRDRLTLEALDLADEVIVVGSADTISLTRLLRGLDDLGTERPHRVLVNRYRRSLRIDVDELAEVIGVTGAPLTVHVLPEDRSAADESVEGHRSIAAGPEGQLRDAMGRVVDAIDPPRGPLRRRKAGRARLR